MTIGLHRSFLLDIFWIGLILVALGSIVVGPWSGTWQLVLSGFLLVAAFVSRRQLRQSVHSLRLSGDGSTNVRFFGRDEAFYPVIFLAPAMVHPWLCVLHLEYEGHRFRLLLLPDSMGSNDFRQLRVWLRWRATFLPEASGASAPYS